MAEIVSKVKKTERLVRTQGKREHGKGAKGLRWKARQRQGKWGAERLTLTFFFVCLPSFSFSVH